jgi:uncharacterized cupredoxin-like copper-binding protein
MKALWFLLSLTLVSALTTGCVPPPPPAAAAKAPASTSATAPAAAPQAVTITATEMAFSPTTVEVRAGQPVALTLRNTGVVEHNWQGKIGDEMIVVTAMPKQSATRTFTAHTPGTYKIVCSVPGHEQAGMIATLVVR